MNKEENNEPETFDGFVDSPVYGISNGEIMDLVSLGNFDMEKEHVVYPYDQSKPYIRISNEDKENLISTMGESIRFDIDIEKQIVFGKGLQQNKENKKGGAEYDHCTEYGVD